jgi:hypothetical protein
MTNENIHQIFPIGTIFKTNYSSLNHRLKTIFENCTRGDCKQQWATEPTEPHIHFVGQCIDHNSESYFGGYVLREGEIVNLFRPEDKILIVEIPRLTQLNLF